ncbi:telomere length regulation protein [Microdochium trichocladiopsis]|uniref:Telomere length regulation protein n=1 Tax=Microdochium trichocladiopsis TaxID=1682393 RepID=A0A9P8YB49_9PEZI|nr:telomere length regulation protein [Microdochium trichocladiopsis]KAH7034809.1 telomere length regulation protein [Microdochium trichocladiopsis]
MDELLTPVSRTYKPSPAHSDDFLTLSQPPPKNASEETKFTASSPDEALEALKSQPSYDKLVSILRYLRKGIEGRHGFDIRQPGPQSAQIVHVLVAEIVPNYWAVLNEETETPKSGAFEALLMVLRSVTGLNSVLIYMRALLKQAQSDPKGLGDAYVALNLKSSLGLLSALLDSEHAITDLWAPIKSLKPAPQGRILRQDLLGLLTNNKLTSISAEADFLLRQADKLDGELWVSSTKAYIDWLLRNILRCLPSTADPETESFCVDLLKRAMRLTNSDAIPQTLFNCLFLDSAKGRDTFIRLMDSLPTSDQKKWLEIIIKHIAKNNLSTIDDSATTADYPIIWAAIGAIRILTGTSQGRKAYLVDWLTNTGGVSIGEGCGIRRAVVGALADDRETLSTILERCTSQFGDQLFIKHAPILQQEAQAQVLLLAAGYVHSLAPIKLTLLLRSSAYLNTISNRIGASQNRSRVLGMVVGEALSGLVHDDKTRLNFKIDEVDTEDAQWYKSLVKIRDQVGPLDQLRETRASSTSSRSKVKTKATRSIDKRPPVKPAQSGFIIEEIEDDEDVEMEDPDLVPYAKPESDDEDSDEDPTMINRDKPKTPVYIRDLIAYFRDTENFDRHKIALTTAPELIRRKANYGTEVTSHAEELATLLVGLENKYELEEFESLRLQGMVAIVLAQPKKMAPWFGRTFFDGDYSLSQRASVLVVLGLSGRELAGFDISEYSAAAAFPSKTLPARVEKHYLPATEARLQGAVRGSHLKALPPNALDNLAQSLSQSFLAPLAAEAADATSGPDVLKLSSFTSRLKDAQGSGRTMSKSTRQTGVKSIPNTTAAIIASSFFFPLTSRFPAAVHSHSAAMRGVLFQPHLLALFIKTLAVLIHAAGPSTLSLPQMTAELWDVLLGVRGQCVGALDVTHAVLVGFISLLDVNENNMRGLCDTHGRQIVETAEWVSNVFDNTRGGDEAGGGEENQVKMMAAGVLIRLREAIEKHQALLMGDLIGYS